MRFNFKGDIHANSMLPYNVKKFKNWDLSFVQFKFIFN